MSNSEMALITKVNPSRTLRYGLMGRVGFDPTSNMVVLQLSKLMRKATAAAR